MATLLRGADCGKNSGVYGCWDIPTARSSFPCGNLASETLPRVVRERRFGSCRPLRAPIQAFVLAGFRELACSLHWDRCCRNTANFFQEITMKSKALIAMAVASAFMVAVPAVAEESTPSMST